MKVKSFTQEEMVLDYMKTHPDRGITALEGFDMFGIMQFPKRIFNLIRQGYNIVSNYETGTNRYGNTVRYKRYYLITENQNI